MHECTYNRNHKHKVEENQKTRQWRLENVASSSTDDLITLCDLFIILCVMESCVGLRHT